MKKALLTTICLILVFSAGAQKHADRQSLTDPESFTMVVFGDPQGYTKYGCNQPLFELSTAWIADNAERLNINSVLFTGDLVEQNENLVPNRKMTDQTSRQMWEWASHCLCRLDGRVPYMICGGNHEYGYVRGDEGFTHYPEYYTPQRNPLNAEHLVAVTKNRCGIPSLENAAWEFHTPAWGDLLIINFEWAPRDEVLAWARDICTKYQDHTVIILLHSLLKNGSGEFTDNENYKIEGANWGRQVWEKLIEPTPNIRLAVCGHTAKMVREAGSAEDFEASTAYRLGKNAAGKDVHMMMFNLQCLGGGWEGNGGDGWLRLLEFLPDGRTIKATTYSVLFGISPMTKHLAHRTDPCCQFEMVIDR